MNISSLPLFLMQRLWLCTPFIIVSHSIVCCIDFFLFSGFPRLAHMLALSAHHSPFPQITPGPLPTVTNPPRYGWEENKRQFATRKVHHALRDAEG